MNAYELADELEDVDAPRYREIAANMLRQQADRIAELEKQLYFKDYYEKLPDTPVGLQTTPQTKPLSDEEIGDFQYLIIRACGLSTCDSNVNAIGLRRILRAIEAKVKGEKTKPLSDEEIHELANQHLRTQDHDGAKVVLGLEDFARAIEERHGIK